MQDPFPDPVAAFDWRDHWARVVETRKGAAGPRQDYWDRRARGFAFAIQAADSTLPDALESWIASHRTLLDVGAGAGRHAAPLADRLDWVTAVEPSLAMRELIPPRSNMTVVGADWLDAEVAPAHLVLCAHVLYGVSDVVPFIEKLETSATEHVFVILRDRPHRRPPDHVTELLTGAAPPRAPRFQDLYNLLRWMGRDPDVEVTTHRSLSRYRDLEMALDDCRIDAGAAWDEVTARRWLEANLTAHPDGGLVYDAGEMATGLAHWAPPR